MQPIDEVLGFLVAVLASGLSAAVGFYIGKHYGYEEAVDDCRTITECDNIKRGGSQS